MSLLTRMAAYKGSDNGTLFSTAALADFVTADVNHDGVVDAADKTIIMDSFNNYLKFSNDDSKSLRNERLNPLL